MAQFSALWTTDDTTPQGHQVAGYTQVQWTQIFRIMSVCNGHPGVAPGYNNELEVVQSGAESINIETGAALVDGKVYEADAPVGFSVPATTGGGNTRIDYIVLRCDWSAYSVVIARIEGTEAASPGVPTVTQNSGSLYELELAAIYVGNSGIESIIDARTFAGPEVDNSTLEVRNGIIQIKDRGVYSGKLDVSAVENINISPSAVTAAKIQNRTRRFHVPAIRVFNITDGVEPSFESGRGYRFSSGVRTIMEGMFNVPDDFVSDLKIYAVLTNYWTTQGGNINQLLAAYYSKDGDGSYAVRGNNYVDNILTIPSGSQNARIFSTVLNGSNAQAGDVVAVSFVRQGERSGDTYAYWLYGMSFEVEYTADS